MKIFTPPFYSRKFHFLFLGGLILLLSCQSDPIVYNPTGGYEYQKKSFQLNKETSETVQGDLHTGMSPRLYSGILSNRDTVSTLIRLLPEVLDSHQVCGADSIINVDILLTSTTIFDTLIQFSALKTYLISYDIFEEDVVLTDDIVNNIKGLTIDILPNVELNTNSIALNLLAYESTIINKWCEEKKDLGVVISYVPTDSTYLEFYSSNGSEVGLGPRLSLEYTVKEETSKNHTCYLINNVSWSSEQMEVMNSGPYFVDDSLSRDWGMIYAMSFNRENQIITNPPLAYDSMTVQTDIVSAGQNSPLITIDLELNPEIANDIDSISFKINNVSAFVSEIDPAGDNWNEETNPDSTENNDTYDHGELFNDYGIDNCPDDFETGDIDNPCDSSFSIYNVIGTEGNDVLDDGEEWFDVGIDGCSDIYESGGGLCAIEETSEGVTGSDPNGDNFITDPAGDDWDPIYLTGSEGNSKFDFIDENGNGIHDEGEKCEPFKDWGTDGLPYELVGDQDENGTEGNGSNDVGEPFDDSGLDSLFNINEANYNADGTEGNNAFDRGGEFFDCGEDNCCNFDGNCNDSADDDYNIDPNNDNYATDSTFTQGNYSLDWTDNNNNGLWDEGEGEKWYDWGIDMVQDTLEAFQSSSILYPNLYDNNYVFEIEGSILQGSPELADSTVNLWISKIEKTGNNQLAIDISIHSNVALKGLQFQLSHTPFTKVDTTLETYTPSIAQLGEDKLFEDFTLLPKKNYSDEELNEKLLIEYSNDLSIFLDFDSLNLFLENEEYIFSHQYSNIVFYIDTINTDVDEDGMRVYLTHSSDSGYDETTLVTKQVFSSSDSVEIKIGQILRLYQSGSIGSYNGLKIKTDANLYNYSKLSINNNPRIDVMYSQ